MSDSPPTPTTTPPGTRSESYGQSRLSLVDRFGVWLSRRALRKVVAGYDKPSILDLGCGYHATLLRWASQISGGTGVGVDVSVSEAAKSEASLRFEEATIERALTSLADQGARFDLVMLISVLEHLWEPQPALAACHRLLKPGGSLVINVPTWRGKRYLEFSAFRLGTSPAAEMDDHKMYYDQRDLWPMLVRAGFRPSDLRLRYHKFGLNLFAVARRQPDPTPA